MVSHWSLSDSKSLKVSRSLLSILTDLNNTVVWMVSTCPLISKSSGTFTNHLEIVPNAPVTIGITVTFMFHSFLVLWQGLHIYFSFRFLLFLLCGLPKRQSPLFSRFSLFSLSITRSGRLDEIRSPVCICLYLKIPENFVRLVF